MIKRILWLLALTIYTNFALAEILSTGQTTCFDQAGLQINCAGTGQDGEFQYGESVCPRFTHNNNGTVTENQTYLFESPHLTSD